jgi:hypothetical protein
MVGMRAPHWLRDFFRWRWAPCVALVAGSLAFIALVLLLMPAPPNFTAQSAAVRHRFDRANAGLPQPAFNAIVAGETVATPGPTAELAPAPVPNPAATIGSHPAPASQPDFVANIADRGDRPQARARRYSLDP